MNLNELAAEVAKRQDIDISKAKKCINCVLDIITEQLMRNEYVYLQRLGKIFMREINWTFREKKFRFLTVKERQGKTTIPHVQISERLKRKCRWRYYP